MAESKKITKIIIIDDRAYLGKDNKLDEGYRKLAYCLKQSFEGLRAIYIYHFWSGNAGNSEDNEETSGNEIGQSEGVQTAENKRETFSVSNVDGVVENLTILKQSEEKLGENLSPVKEAAKNEKDSTLILLDVVLTSANDENEKEQAIQMSIKIFEILKKEYKVLSYTNGKKDATVKRCFEKKEKEEKECYYNKVLDVTWFDPRHFANSVKYMYENCF